MPIEEIIVSKRLRGARKAYKPLVLFKSPPVIIRSFILGRSIISSQHVWKIVLVIVLVAIVSFLTKPFLTFKMMSIMMFISFLGPAVVVASISSTLANYSLVRDIHAYWVYRMYLINMRPVAENMLIKYLVYLLESLTGLAIFWTIIAGNPLWLLYPVTMLPISIIG